MASAPDSFEDILKLKLYKGNPLRTPQEIGAAIEAAEKLHGNSKERKVFQDELWKYINIVRGQYKIDPAAFYEVPSDKHMTFHESLKRYRILVAANRTRKTTSLCQEVYWWMTRSHPYRPTFKKEKLNIWWLGPNYQDYVEQVLYRKLVIGDGQDPFAPRFGEDNPYGFVWKKDDHRLVNDKGDTISFKSADKTVPLTKFASENVDLIVVDEPIRGDIWGECEARLVSTGGQAIIGLTATDGLGWLHEQFFLPWKNGERDDVEFIKLSMYDVPSFFPEGEIEHFEGRIRRAEGERGVMVRVYGEFMPLVENSLFDPKALHWYSSMPEPMAEFRGELVVQPGKKEPKLSSLNDGRLRIWKMPEASREYVVGADPCLGQGNSYGCAVVVDVASWDIVAEWHGRVDPDVFGSDIVSKLGWLYGEACVWGENNNHGQIFIQALVDSGYSNIGVSRRDMSRVRGAAAKSMRLLEVLGVNTNRKTKPIIFDLLRAGFRDRLFGFVPHDIVDEASYMGVEGENEDRFIREPTKRDDRVMALGFAVYGIQELQSYGTGRRKKTKKKDKSLSAWIRKRHEMAG